MGKSELSSRVSLVILLLIFNTFKCSTRGVVRGAGVRDVGHRVGGSRVRGFGRGSKSMET